MSKGARQRVRFARSGPVFIILGLVLLGVTVSDGAASAGATRNTAPVAHDQQFATSAGSPAEVTLYATDADGNKLSFLIKTKPQGGSLSGTAPSLLYTPAPGYSGTDSFTWTASDGHVTSNVATVSITVVPANTATTGSIVVLKGQVDPAENARRHAASAKKLYRTALHGYAADLTAAQRDEVARDPDVLYVAADHRFHAITDTKTDKSNRRTDQILGPWIDRIDGEQSSTASGDGTGKLHINVAVLDTGIDSKHPDLNVGGGINCVTGQDPSNFQDDNGHGTGVAGVIGALDNKIGIVGVAPGARVWPVKVADPTGFIAWSDLLCGLDWVASTHRDGDIANDFAVANLSLGGPASDLGLSTADDGHCGLVDHDPVHTAICALTNDDVVVVASAGNDAVDVKDVVPAGYHEVLTTAGMADTDGKPGGLGGIDTCFGDQSDDTPATFSNFASLAADQSHIVAAPAVCIRTTFPSSLSPGGAFWYATWGGGTSFASPAAAGTVALCIMSGPCEGLTPAQIIQKIVGDGAAYNIANPGYGFQGDPLRPDSSGKYYGYLIRAGMY